MNKYFILVLTILAPALFLSCGEKSTESEPGFWVKIIDQYRDPVVGTHIQMYFYLNSDLEPRITNGFGLAHCSEDFRDRRVIIFRNNYYTLFENNLEPGTYTLESTPWKFGEIGDVLGFAIKMDDNYIVTASLDDKYHVYSYDDYSVTELVTGYMPVWDLMGGMEFRTYDNLLWYSAGGDGIYVYNLTSPSNPALVAHHQIEGVIQGFAKENQLLVVGCYQNGYYLHFFQVNAPDDIEEINVIESDNIQCLGFANGNLVTHSYYGITTVLDVQDPYNIEEIYSGAIYEYSHGFFHGDTLVLVQIPDFGGDNSGTQDHYMVTFDNPANPQVAFHLLSDDYISSFVNDTLAFCTYELPNFTTGLLRRKSREEFETAAVLSENSGPALAYPPYFVIDEKLWTLTQSAGTR